MINVNNLKSGVTFEYENNIYFVINFQHFKIGRNQAHIKVKVKNLKTNFITNITFFSGTKVKKALIEKINIQFLYSNKKEFFFMNLNNYEQIEIPFYLLEKKIKFINEGMIITAIKYYDNFLDFILPEKINLKIIEIENAVKGDTNSSCVMKKAKLETGLEVMVPIFIKKNDKIWISTKDGKYINRF